jgi:UDP-N-acetylmuramoylalanine--D-glutamate ligase
MFLMDAKSYFEGKRITLMGLGLLGRAVGDIRYLAECGAELIVTDLKSAEALASSTEELTEFPNITYVLGEHRLEDFRDRDLILKAAGVPLDSIYIAEAEKEGIPVRMSADLFVEISGVRTIGITGTRGKSTVTHMIAGILATAGRKVLLGGNIRGVSTLALLNEVTLEHIAVLELDSWQLQGFGVAKLSPHIAVFTTFFPDHLNYYHDDLNAYLADKANIFLNQVENDIFILGSQATTAVRDRYQDEILSDIMVVSEEDLPADWELRIPGEHNRYNAAIARAAAREEGVDDEISRTVLESFPGVPGRLELVKEVSGVKIYNDTTATTPTATLAALAALDTGNKNTILIMGGADKGLDMNSLLLEIPNAAKRVLMLAGTGTSRVAQWLPDASIFDSLEAATKEAFSYAKPGDTILFSPAFASFGMFKNEYDRGDQFNGIVNTL